MFVNCGAREDINHAFVEHLPDTLVIGFEPDKEECERLSRNAKKGYVFFPVAVGRKDETKTLHVTHNLSCSSLYRPNTEFANHFLGLASYLNVIDTQLVNVTSLDVHLQNQKIERVDFLKIDTQGAELDILQGAEKLLASSVLGIRVEVEFSPIYKEQPMFSEIETYVRKFGFVLFDLDRYHLRRKKSIEGMPSKEQLVWGQALFLKDYQTLDSENNEGELLKLAVLSSSYGFHSYAIEIIDFITASNNQFSATEKSLIQQARLKYIEGLQQNLLVKCLIWIRRIKAFEIILSKLGKLTQKFISLLKQTAPSDQYFWVD